MRRIRKDALDLEFLPETCKVKFIGPERISYFSTYFDENHEEVHRFDNSSLRYLDVAKLDIPINCLEGLNPESDACVLPMTWSYFMRWIVDNDKLIRGLTPENGSQQQIDFICTNTELKQIMLSLYQESDWNILAHKTTSGIIFYSAYDEETSDNTDSAPQCNPMKKKLSCARFNVIRKITEAVKDRERICNTEMDIFSTISFSVIGQHRILHTGFTEFVMSKDDADKPIDQADFAALKLKPNLFRGRKGDFNIRQYRHLYWWASALVTGVKTFICGDLNKDFTLRKLDVLPASLLEKKSAYERKKCLITLDKILHFIKAEVKEQNRMYKFYLDVKTREVVVTPSEKPIEDYTPPWCKLGDTGVIAFDFGK